ncbi:hypothetical protein ACTMTF_15340 [Nonomuraea sp. ZG12]|uniref:hypothetical protein n=1 Tax=Nonomuraea sp. ZG12 TaxID=3452207 RepID=UPI003F89DAAA
MAYWDPRDDKIKELEAEVTQLKKRLDEAHTMSGWQMSRISELEDELENRPAHDCPVLRSELEDRLTRLEDRFEFVRRENGFWDGS